MGHYSFVRFFVCFTTQQAFIPAGGPRILSKPITVLCSVFALAQQCRAAWKLGMINKENQSRDT
jgi:hypothetical protein